jgi:membrane associated rhomboid family serine protease
VATCYRHPDRETGLSCSECGRPICYECMTPAAVGLRCPDHAGAQAATRRPGSVTAGLRRFSLSADDTIVTKTLIAVNVLVFLVNLAQGASLGRNGGQLFIDGVLYGPAVADGEWWRLITAAFLHGGIIHLAFNMYFLWLVGQPVEAMIGRWRFIVLYFVSALAGSAGALLFAPETVTVGASGALFGLLGAAVVFEQQGMHVLGGSAIGIAAINFAITLLVPGISLGGHLGGFVGGALCGLALSRFGRGHAAYGRVGLVGVAGMLAVGIASVVVSYLKVRGYT